MEKKKIKISPKIWIPLVAVGAVLLILAIVLPSVYFGAYKTDVKVNVSQLGDSQTISLDWESGKKLDKLSVAVYHGDDLVSKKDLSKPEELSGEIKADVFYGKMRVEISAKRGMYTFNEKISVNVSADEYNIAPITDTMPVTLFTLSLQELTNNGSIPTFVWFKRSGAWDWNKLPQGVYAMPVAGDRLLNADETVMYSKTKAWVKELYEINKDAKFHFFFSDYFAQGYLDMTMGNKIPAENYNVYLLSDGTASFKYYNDHFNNADAETEYNRMAAQWATLKQQVATNGSYDYNSNYAISANDLREYAYVIATEETNVEWWLTGNKDNRVFAPNNAEFFQKLKDNEKIKTMSLNTLLTAIKEREDNEFLTETKLKTLYKFSDTTFEKAVEENKKIMIILGTYNEYDGTEYNRNEYIMATMAFYGDEYVYYYKGHPRHPTDTIPGKAEELEELGLIDLDATIPAELFFFFNPDAFASGYTSTTYLSIKGESDCALFHLTKSEALNNADTNVKEYSKNMDLFISKIANGELNGTVNGDNCFLVEFSDKILETAEFELALFNADTKVMTYYKLDGTNYVEVQR